jgi:hypothetical protein
VQCGTPPEGAATKQYIKNKNSKKVNLKKKFKKKHSKKTFKRKKKETNRQILFRKRSRIPHLATEKNLEKSHSIR